MFHFLQMIGLDPSLGVEVTYTYDKPLLLLSYLIAVLAAYSASAVVERIRAASSKRAHAAWLIAGAFTAGLGTWTMHFTGMLAVQLPFVVDFALVPTLVSIVPAIIGSAFAIHFTEKDRDGLFALFLSATSLALGIGLMHYMGMGAMRMDAIMRYDGMIVGASLLIAFFLATVTLLVQKKLRRRAPGPTLSRLIGAVMMGVTISAMHYMAMAAVTYYVTPTTEVVLDSASITSTWLAILIVLSFVVIASVTLIGTAVDRQLDWLSQELRESLEGNAAILDQMQDGLISISRSGVIERTNPKAAELFEVNSADGIDLHVAHFLPDAVRRLDNGEYEPRLGTYETIARRAGGQEFRAELSVIKITVTNELTYTAFVRDQTARLQMETQLRQAQKLESIGQMAAGIAHEINTPIQFVGDNTVFLQRAFGSLEGVLQASTELLESVEADDDQENAARMLRQHFQKARIDYLQEQVPRALSQSLEGLERVSGIVLAMKEFSHPSQGTKVPVDIAHCIDVTLTVARNEWKYVADIETDYADDLPLVPCLRDEFNQVILNMVVNSAHAIEAGSGEEGDRGKIVIKTSRAGDFAVIQISDTGAGIPDAIRHQVFDPFFTTKEVGKGTGQGLAIARNVIVDKHGGSIDVDSKRGVGTTFTLRIPLIEMSDAGLAMDAA